MFSQQVRGQLAVVVVYFRRSARSTSRSAKTLFSNQRKQQPSRIQSGWILLGLISLTNGTRWRHPILLLVRRGSNISATYFHQALLKTSLSIMVDIRPRWLACQKILVTFRNLLVNKQEVKFLFRFTKIYSNEKRLSLWQLSSFYSCPAIIPFLIVHSSKVCEISIKF